MIYSYQPEILINSRLDASGENLGSIMGQNPQVFSGDFACPEQLMPPQALKNEAGEHVPWEICVSMNESWGYNAADKNYKSADLLIKKLTEAVSKGGTMILNVGPDARGNISQRRRNSRTIGAWLKIWRHTAAQTAFAQARMGQIHQKRQYYLRACLRTPHRSAFIAVNR